MKSSLLWALASILLAAAGCNRTKTEDATNTAAADTCAAAGKPVRTVTDVRGFVSLDAASGQYRVFAPEPGTVDVVNVGVVCGTLPPELRAEGRKVVFSGTYRAYGQPAPNAPAGYTYYYLELGQITPQ